MFDFFHALTQKSAIFIGASLAAISGVFFQPNIVIINPSPILVLPVSGEPASTSTEQIQQIKGALGTIGEITELKSMVGGLLPAVKLNLSPATTIQPKQALQPQKKETPQVKLPSVSKISTPQDFLNATSFLLNQKIDGSYFLSFRANAGSDNISWGFTDETVGGTVSIPKMNISYSCNPQWNAPATNSPDQNPTFGLNTSYSCDISVIDSLMRTANKKINFQTGAGRLVIKSSNLSTLLKSGVNANGFVFDNQSDAKLAITDIVFDISFKSLNVSSPIIVRFINPDNESSFSDFPVQEFLADSAKPDMKIGTGIKPSLSFNLNPHSQRLLQVQVLGVQQLLTVGVNPEFNVILRQAVIDNSNIKTVFFSPAISWSCITFDPRNSLTGIPDEQNCR